MSYIRATDESFHARRRDVDNATSRRSILGEAYVTAPSTPVLERFPCIAVNPPEQIGPAEGSPRRTPHSCISSSTAVSSVESLSGVCKERDVEKGLAGGPDSRPFPLKWWSFALLATVICAVALECSLWKNKRDGGWPAPTALVEEKSVQHFLLTKPLTVVLSMIFSWIWSSTVAEIQRMQPFLNLADQCSHKRTADNTIFLDYTQSSPYIVLLKSSWRGDFFVLWACVLVLLTQTFQPLSAALVSVEDVWWLYPSTNATLLTQVAQHTVQNSSVLDMIAFQGASGFATARVLYGVTLPTFVTESGYTVETFELPRDVNGTVYANVSAVHNQAACVSPTTFELTQNQATLAFSIAADFSGCRFSWTVNNTSIEQFAVVPLLGSDCEEVGPIPAQFSKTAWIYFSPGKSPWISVVQCTVGLSVAHVSVAVDLVSGTTSVSTAFDVPSIIGTQNTVYNGLFFDEGLLEREPLTRLQGIQQQLPGAVFQAAKAKDPYLVETFTTYGFTNITADIYNTYLSLIAKRLYFVEQPQAISVQVGAKCSRGFLVPRTVHSLFALLLLVAVGAAFLEVIHRWRCQHLFIPPYLGTLGCALWFSADLDLGHTRAGAERRGGPAGVRRPSVPIRELLETIRDDGWTPRHASLAACTLEVGKEGLSGCEESLGAWSDVALTCQFF